MNHTYSELHTASLQYLLLNAQSLKTRSQFIQKHKILFLSSLILICNRFLKLSQYQIKYCYYKIKIQFIRNHETIDIRFDSFKRWNLTNKPRYRGSIPASQKLQNREGDLLSRSSLYGWYILFLSIQNLGMSKISKHSKGTMIWLSMQEILIKKRRRIAVLSFDSLV